MTSLRDRLEDIGIPEEYVEKAIKQVAGWLLEESREYLAIGDMHDPAIASVLRDLAWRADNW